MILQGTESWPPACQTAEIAATHVLEFFNDTGITPARLDYPTQQQCRGRCLISGALSDRNNSNTLFTILLSLNYVFRVESNSILFGYGLSQLLFLSGLLKSHPSQQRLNKSCYGILYITS